MKKEKDSIWQGLAKMLGGGRKPIGTRDYTKILEQLAGTGKRKSSPDKERFPKSVELMQRSELLYRLDPLVFAGVNKLTRLTSGNMYVDGESPAQENLDKWLGEIGLKVLLPDLVKDIFLYGYGVAEILRNPNSDITGLAQLDPKYVDYQRNEDNTIARNSDGTIKGYVQEAQTVPNEDKTFAPEDILIMKFFSVGEECIGITPIEPIFKASWIRLNLEEAMAESIYRHGYPLFYYQIGTAEWEKEFGVFTPEKAKEAKEFLKNLDSQEALILPYWITPNRLDARSEIGDLSQLLQYFSGLVLAGLEMPKMAGATSKELMSTADFEKTIQSFQELLSNQLYYQLVKQHVAKHPKEYPTTPEIKFAPYDQTQKLLKARRLGHYANKGLIVPDGSMEDAIRLSEGFKPRKKDKETSSDQCVYGYGVCKVRQNEKTSLDTLSNFCKSCVKRKRKELAENLEE